MNVFFDLAQDLFAALYKQIQNNLKYLSVPEHNCVVLFHDVAHFMQDEGDEFCMTQTRLVAGCKINYYDYVQT